MNNKILKEIEKVPFTRDVKNMCRDSDGEIRVCGDSNVKALQTTGAIESKALSLLRQWICDTTNKIAQSFDFKILSYWVARYNKGDYTLSHAHIPAPFAFVYFLKSPIGSSPLVFSTSDRNIEPEEGNLIIFPGNLNHHVPKNECDGRIVFSGNLFPIY